MIANEVRRRVTQAVIRQFEEGLARLGEDARNRPEWIRKGFCEGMESQIADLRQELADYDDFRLGRWHDNWFGEALRDEWLAEHGASSE